MNRFNTQRNIQYGMTAGAVAGIFFSLVLSQMEIFTVIGAIGGLKDPLYGLLVHFAVSALLGIVFALIFKRSATRIIPSSLWGMVFGVILWVLGPLIAMPILLKQPLASEWMIAAPFPPLHFLMGHIFYGLVLGIIYGILRKYCSAPSKKKR